MRAQIVAGNWKMNKDHNQAISLVEEIKEMMSQEATTADKVIVAPPFPYLSQVNEMTTSVAGLHTSAQNCHQKESGAYTGEISASMLQSIGVEYVILGHSERREYFDETNELLAEKVVTVLNHGLQPIFCCGEPLSIREAEEQESYVTNQLTASLFQLPPDNLKKIVIAYEPIWAIGTGKTASAAQAQEMHASIRQHLAENYGASVADQISILYGGSCKPSNAREIFAGPDVDGGLIGGASLKAEDFVAIANSFE